MDGCMDLLLHVFCFDQQRFDFFFFRSVARATLSFFFCMYVCALDLLIALMRCLSTGGSQSMVSLANGYSSYGLFRGMVLIIFFSSVLLMLSFLKFEYVRVLVSTYTARSMYVYAGPHYS